MTIPTSDQHNLIDLPGKTHVPAMDTQKRRITVAEALSRIPKEGGETFTTLLEHGSLEVECYAPRGKDLQSPHTRDEIYVIIAGTGEFVNGPKRSPFGLGDVLFVPAGVEHRFENFSDNFSTWVFFYGPEGGEVDEPKEALF